MTPTPPVSLPLVADGVFRVVGFGAPFQDSLLQENTLVGKMGFSYSAAEDYQHRIVRPPRLCSTQPRTYSAEPLGRVAPHTISHTQNLYSANRQNPRFTARFDVSSAFMGYPRDHHHIRAFSDAIQGSGMS